MASSKPRIFTYRVVPRFDINAADGPLQLGTVVKNLIELAPLNRKEADREPIPDDAIYPPTTQTGFHATRKQLQAGKFEIWAKALGLGGVGGSHVGAGGEQSNEETISCDSIVTTYFDPTDDWAAKCLAAKPVHEYIVSSGYKKEVYIVVGLKVATNLKFGSETACKANAETKVEVNVPEAPIGVGAEGGVNKERGHTLGFQSTNIVVGFRVKKYQYKRKNLFKWKELKGELYTKNAEMLDSKTRPLRKLNQFEEVPIEEEVLAQEAFDEHEGSMEECWVN
ncbi:hypothetical protein F4820DRAFT_467532 [Hypoxylon rubiginosum]|uniref:Uncharacterized protein n=1 Tax=Hypoxylon rubiginosum TaxID=110542 RepID=A0ACB9Z847_9PEZI|nr:hypothetical protein F4820DRAFT_467532 [Hypoxylon rubiginosum]